MNFGIIAAGQGSRLVQEGVSLPKPLVEICGQPMIGRLIDIFVRCGASSVNVIVNEEMTEVAAYLSEIADRIPCPLNVVVKTTPTSMHSFYELSSLMEGKGRYIITTVDTIFREEDFARYVEAYRNAPEETDGMMAVTSFIEDEKPLYVAVADGARITGFLDSPEDGVEYVSGGIYGLSQSAIPVLGKCLDEGVGRMRNYQRALVAAGLDLKAYDMGKIVDVDHASDIVMAENFIKGAN
ncbi:MAG: NTP transferase domain-containing protein [Muribaculaceae bacterium]|nr:NTP transferase domain-containing protein [Muribaculaceae bacterium]MDE6534350.1 NTP transferase domain-containing protein [Muribaculaceae bacterium]